MLSFHPNKRDWYNESLYAGGFKVVDTDDVEIIGKLIITFATSVIYWRGGQRSKSNFVQANWLMLDFDDGMMPLEVLTGLLSGTTHVIGASKSHMKEKRDKYTGAIIAPALERFHLYMKLPRMITDCEEYSDITRYYAYKLLADKAAVDPARKFHPCTKVLSAKEGEPIEIRKKGRHQPQTTPQRSSIGPLDNKVISQWVLDKLSGREQTIDGNRNATCYRVAKHLQSHGYSMEEVFDKIMASPIPKGPRTKDEVWRTIQNAYRN